MTARARAVWLVSSPRRILLVLGTLLVVGVLVANIATGPKEFPHEARWLKDMLGGFALIGLVLMAVSFIWIIARHWQAQHPPPQPSRYHKPDRR
jgi:hypothetical protein